MSYLRDMDDLSHTLHAHAKKKGFYEPYEHMDESDYVVFYLKQLAMVHSEVSEVLEAIRKDKGDDIVVEELADIILVCLNIATHFEIDIEKELNNKITINEKR